MKSKTNGGEWNIVFLFFNGTKMMETEHSTYSDGGRTDSTGGRVVTLEASAGDTIYLRTTRMDGDYVRIIFCAEYIAKMDSALSANFSSSSTGTEGNKNGRIFKILSGLKSNGNLLN